VNLSTWARKGHPAEARLARPTEEHVTAATVEE
jgi:hypothetical protein